MSEWQLIVAASHLLAYPAELLASQPAPDGGSVPSAGVDVVRYLLGRRALSGLGRDLGQTQEAGLLAVSYSSGMVSLGALLLAADFAYSSAFSFPATAEWADIHRMVTVLSLAIVLEQASEMMTAKHSPGLRVSVLPSSQRWSIAYPFHLIRRWQGVLGRPRGLPHRTPPCCYPSGSGGRST